MLLLNKLFFYSLWCSQTFNFFFGSSFKLTYIGFYLNLNVPHGSVIPEVKEVS